MGKITKVSEHIEQVCRVYGEHWRPILFKKWTFFEDIYPENSCVCLVLKPSPSINRRDHIYDTEKEATEALIKKQNERLEKVMNKGEWTGNQFDTYWVRGLEDDVRGLHRKVKK